MLNGSRTTDLLVAVARLLTTGEAAKALSIARGTLARWQRDGLVEPAEVTAGGHARWDVDDLREQIKKLRRQSG